MRSGGLVVEWVERENRLYPEVMRPLPNTVKQPDSLFENRQLSELVPPFWLRERV